MNCLLQANARDIAGGTLYVTRMPCFTCAKVISNAGLFRVVYREDEADADREPERSRDMMWSSGLVVIPWTMPS
jgi:deoxycytidylate deaminase